MRLIYGYYIGILYHLYNDAIDLSHPLEDVLFLPQTFSRFLASVFFKFSFFLISPIFNFQTFFKFHFFSNFQVQLFPSFNFFNFSSYKFSIFKLFCKFPIFRFSIFLYRLLLEISAHNIFSNFSSFTINF